MEILNIVGIILFLTFMLSYINHKYIKLPTTIGLMLISMIISLSLVIIGHFGPIEIEQYAHKLISAVNFNETLMIGMLGFLLFAGALHVNINDLLEKKWEIGIFSTFGVLASTFIIGSVMYFIFQLLEIDINYIYALLFGSLISPTDPIAVMGIIKNAKAPKSLETKIAGESLFNDGIGVVIFLTILGIAVGENHFSLKEVSFLFIEEAIGGVILGLATGYIAYRLLKSIDNYQIEIIGTLTLVVGTYALASKMHLSGPIAIVIAGLLIGNHGRKLAMSEKTRVHLDSFWVLIDDILNAVLFTLIGLEILALRLSTQYITIGFLAIFVVLLARFLSIGIPIRLLKLLRREFTDKVIRIMTWGGLRGGISIALALSLPRSIPQRELILTITYVVVAFSIIVQGLTIKKLIQA